MNNLSTDRCHMALDWVGAGSHPPPKKNLKHGKALRFIRASPGVRPPPPKKRRSISPQRGAVSFLHSRVVLSRETIFEGRPGAVPCDVDTWEQRYHCKNRVF